MDTPDYYKIGEEVNRTRTLSVKLNNATDPVQIRELLDGIIGKPVDEGTTVFTPVRPSAWEGSPLKMG